VLKWMSVNAAFVPETYALLLATMYVYANAQDNVSRQAKEEQNLPRQLDALGLFPLGPEEVKEEGAAEDCGDIDTDEDVVRGDAKMGNKHPWC
jgi:hypothetical protein